MPFLYLVLLPWFPVEPAPPVINQLAGRALIVCAQLGLPPKQIAQIFGRPDSAAEGKIDWRENPDRYLLWQYDRFNVWVEWEAGPFPRTGTGKQIQVLSGSVE